MLNILTTLQRGKLKTFWHVFVLNIQESNCGTQLYYCQYQDLICQNNIQYG